MENRSKWMLYGIVLIMGLRISTYFTLFPDSVAMTQLVKTGLRVALTGIVYLMQKNMAAKYRSHQPEYENFTPLLLYAAYLLLGIISLFWTSSASYSMLQLSMIIEALVFSWFFSKLLVVYNAASDDHARFAFVFGRATMLISLAFIIGLLANPDLFYRQTHGGEVSRLGGFIINPNELGMLGVLGAVMAYVELLRKRPAGVNLLVMVSSVAVLLLTQSRSSLGAFLLVTGIYVLKSRNVKLQIASVIGAILVIPVLVQTIILKQGDMEEVMSMTGRLPFWKDLIADGFTQRPLLGFGFMRIAEGEYFDSIHAYSAKMTHNTFIQVLLNLGLTGSFICLLQMVATTFVISRCRDADLKNLAVMMLIPVIINSSTEFGIFGESNYGIQFYQLIILFFVVRKKTSPIPPECTAKENKANNIPIRPFSAPQHA